MNLIEELALVKKYCPNIYFDKNEPFFPERIGYTIFESSRRSPSFPREIEFYDEKIKYVIEYAIYWDFDIEHLYELEHIWVYVDTEGNVCDSEGSFHGRYFKALLDNGSNIEGGTHVRLYSQPGKHAFSPLTELFKLIPDLRTATYEKAGGCGLITTSVCNGRYETSDKINEAVRKYLQGFRFHPSMEFVPYTAPEDIFVPWQQLYDEIPTLISEKLDFIYSVIGE